MILVLTTPLVFTVMMLLSQGKTATPCEAACLPADADCPIRGGFRVTACSPAVGAGVPIPEVTTDFYGNRRDPLHPTIGAVEYVGQVPPMNLKGTVTP